MPIVLKRKGSDRLLGRRDGVLCETDSPLNAIEFGTKVAARRFALEEGLRCWFPFAVPEYVLEERGGYQTWVRR